MNRRTWPLILVVGLCTACGARSALSVAGAGGSGGTGGSGGSGGTGGSGGVGGTGGTGGSGGTGGTGATGGMGGTGGLSVACTVAMPVAVLNDPGGDDDQPNLVNLFSPPDANALVFSRQVLPPVAGPVAQVGIFTGWGPWPPPELAAGVTNPLAPWNGVDPYPAAWILAAAPVPPEVWAFDTLIGAADPNQTTLTQTIYYPSGNQGAEFNFAGMPLTLRVFGDGGATFTGGSMPVGSMFALNVGVVKPGQGVAPLNLGCATTPVAVDSAVGPGGWLLAAAVGTPLVFNLEYGWDPGICMAAGNVGPAATLQLATLDWNATPGPSVQSLPASAPVSRIRMAARSDGAWVVWSEQGQPGLSGVLLDTAAAPGLPFHTFTQISGLVDGAFDVQPLADVLAIAAVHRVSGQNDVVEVELLGGTAQAPQVLWSTTVPTDGQVDGSPHLLASPGSDALLLAWSERLPGAPARRLRVARIDCPGGP